MTGEGDVQGTRPSEGTAYVAVGSNIDAVASILKGLRLLDREAPILSLSTFYRTEPVGPPGQPPFVNGVAAVATDAAPRELQYVVLRRVEAATGRVRGSDRYAPRTLDLDLVLHGDRVVRDGGLALPDPDLTCRRYLAVCLLELAPGIVLPGTSSPLRDPGGPPMERMRGITLERVRHPAP